MRCAKPQPYLFPVNSDAIIFGDHGDPLQREERVTLRGREVKEELE